MSLIFSVLALGIYVEVRGRAHCIWTERCANVEENHVGNETYLEEKIYLIGGPSGKLKLLRGKNAEAKAPVGRNGMIF